MSPDLSDLPNVDAQRFRRPGVADLAVRNVSTHPPRILLLYGSLRARSFSKVLNQRGAMERETTARQALCADIDAFSMHAAVRVEAHEKRESAAPPADMAGVARRVEPSC